MCCGLGMITVLSVGDCPDYSAGNRSLWGVWVITLLSVGDNVAGSTALTTVLVIGQLLPPSATRIQHPGGTRSMSTSN